MKNWVHNPSFNFSVHLKVDQIASANGPVFYNTTHCRNSSSNSPHLIIFSNVSIQKILSFINSKLTRIYFYLINLCNTYFAFKFQIIRSSRSRFALDRARACSAEFARIFTSPEKCRTTKCSMLSIEGAPSYSATIATRNVVSLVTCKRRLHICSRIKLLWYNPLWIKIHWKLCSHLNNRNKFAM